MDKGTICEFGNASPHDVVDENAPSEKALFLKKFS